MTWTRRLSAWGLTLSVACCATAEAAAPATAPAAPSAEWAGLSRLALEASDIAIGDSLDGGQFVVGSDDDPRSERISKWRVRRVLKGDLTPGAVVSVGRSLAQWEITADAKPGALIQVRHLEPTRRYLLFLRRAAGRNGYAIAGDAAGLFEIQSGSAIPYDARPESPAWRAAGTIPLDPFLKALEGLAR